MSHRLTLVATFFALAASLSAADPLATVFDRIDAAAKTFKGMQADLSNTHHTAIIDDDDTATGTIKLLRVTSGPTLLLVDLKGGLTGSVTAAMNEKEYRSYNPNTKILTVYSLSNIQDLVTQFMALGFGATSTELKTPYDVSYVAEEKIGGQDTSHLALVPKSKQTLQKLKRADLWYTASGLVTQQKFTYPSGDYQLLKYSNLKLTPPAAKDLQLNPKGATIQKQEK